METKAVAYWVLLCCIMIVLMVGIGGFTRLTHSGLSITEWNPITGILPPLSKQEWIKEKSKYESTPEYKVFNHDISIKEFQIIYMIEYIHRLIARFTGLVFILPFIYFKLKKKLSRKTTALLCIVLLLGILQAFVGWYMVKSGLDITPHVSHYRLAFHFSLALIIFSLLLYQFLNYQIKPQKAIVYNTTICYLKVILIMVVIQMIFGAFVAGLNAGLIFNTFPLMEGNIIPSDLFFLKPLWLNCFENRVTVQFIHRMLAFLILILTAIVTLRNSTVKSLRVILLLIVIQVILGIATLLLKVQIAFAILHQVFSFILFASVLYSLCTLNKN
ncbi:MAG: COX15/CtaA family protein [Wolbachia endosymbiont of Fragariocoptes setiger]|nr:COX15/CtaA family protein [Wolbachia endosymbiont of Fragariocoptes setiger]